MTWQASSSQSLADTNTSTGNPLWSDFTIAFQGVELDIDTLFGGSSGIIGSVFSSLSDALDNPSLKLVIGLLNTQVPILNESIADLIGGSVGEVVSAIYYIQHFEGISSSNGSDTYINLGSFNIASSANFDNLATGPLSGLLSDVNDVTNSLQGVLTDANFDLAPGVCYAGYGGGWEQPNPDFLPDHHRSRDGLRLPAWPERRSRGFQSRFQLHLGPAHRKLPDPGPDLLLAWEVISYRHQFRRRLRHPRHPDGRPGRRPLSQHNDIERPSRR